MIIAVYLVILVAAFYFLIVRPQRRQSQMRRQLISQVQVGDEIVTSGGLIATIVGEDDETLDIEIAPGVVVKLARGAVAAKTNPPYESDEDDDGDEADGDEDEDDVPGGEDDDHTP